MSLVRLVLRQAHHERVQVRHPPHWRFGWRRRPALNAWAGHRRSGRRKKGWPGGLGLGPERCYAAAMSTIALTVNGRSHTVDVDPATPLLYVLSDDLALRGPKFGCGLGQCGACTVIVARPRDPLVRHAGRAPSNGAEITTLEGLGTLERPHPDSAGVHRRAGGAVRLLPERRHPDGEGVPRSEPEGDRRRDSAGAVRRALPLLRAHADAARDHARTRRRQRDDADASTRSRAPDSRAATS